MAPPVQMVQSIRHDQLVSNMSANRTFQSKWGLSEFLQSRRLLADEAAGCSKMKESRLIGVGVLSCVEDDGVPADGQSSTTSQQLVLFLLILHPQGSKEGDELPENAVVWKQVTENSSWSTFFFLASHLTTCSEEQTYFFFFRSMFFFLADLLTTRSSNM
ncbi:uncharacterized protein LOC144008130 [Festucalex cinctus]